MAARYYTLEEANGRLPWLRQNLQEQLSLQQQLLEAREAHRQLRRHSRRNGSATDEEALAEKQGQSERALRRFERLAQQVEQEGIVVRDLARGLVDFPALREGREVCLCWTLDEPEIAFWHEVDAGYAGRQPLV